LSVFEGKFFIVIVIVIVLETTAKHYSKLEHLCFTQ